ncbi:YesL family protein [Alloscardovia venturai]|uniref:YesL family protein n=1 Tax=Alloscardovia venturai TaxID=1769421 RepID=A0ABW2Y4L0_9BIFI
MNGFFNQKNWFYQAMGTLFDLVVLNVVTLIVSLPIFTAGAALTSLHYVLWRTVRGEDGPLLRMYFQSFKENFKQVTSVWLVMIVLAFIGGADVYFDMHMQKFIPSASRVMQLAFIALVAIVTVVAVAIVQWYTILASRYTNTNRVHLKNAVLISLGYFPQTLGMLILLMGTAIAAAAFYSYALIPMVILGVSLPQYLCALIYTTVFKKLDGETGSDGETGRDKR